jgi:hypothetical protein
MKVREAMAPAIHLARPDERTREVPGPGVAARRTPFAIRRGAALAR